MENIRKRVALHNLGCKVNAYEMEAMEQELRDAGYDIVPFAPGADVYIINTCTVTNIADRKSRQMLHKARKMNPEAIVIAAGCYVQAQKDAEQVDEAIDIVLGNNRKQELLDILKNYRKGQGQKKIVTDLEKTVEYENLMLSSTVEHTRAYLKVQDGCNQFCSYCIIPYLRGRSRSRPIFSIINEVSLLSEQIKEIVLTGINVTDYKIDGKEGLLTLLNELDTFGKRLRLSSIEESIISEKFIEGLSKLSNFCPHFHLSLQSGCDNTLKKMNRHYTSEDFFNTINLIRKYFPLAGITTDVIVGFPTENEEDFNITSYIYVCIEFRSFCKKY